MRAVTYALCLRDLMNVRAVGYTHHVMPWLRCTEARLALGMGQRFG